jgi:hypothetical protein
MSDLSRFDFDRHLCRPNPVECPLCHGDGTGTLDQESRVATLVEIERLAAFLMAQQRAQEAAERAERLALFKYVTRRRFGPQSTS